MNKVKKCVVCGSKNILSFPAYIAPFVSERVFGSLIPNVALVHCSDCDFVFYDPRFNEAEMNKLYNGYRNGEYQKQRQKHEDGYTNEINEMIGKNQTEIDVRGSALSEICNKYLQMGNIKTVLDYGGDFGQHIPKCLKNTARYVYEVSGVVPIEGIRVIENIDSCQIKFDFIMCCHVLEHVPYPTQVIEQILKCSHKATVVYFELPYDSSYHSEKNRDVLGKIAYSHPFLLKIYNSFNSLFGRPWRPLRPFQMHEHINHFSLVSLKKMLDSKGVDVIFMDRQILDFGWTKMNVLRCLASVR